MTKTVHRTFRPVAPERRVYKGEQYGSLTEARYARHLDSLIAIRQISWWLRQVPVVLGCAENRYRVDFLVFRELEDRSLGVEAIDVKPRGVETREFRRWVKLWKSHGPCDLFVAYAQGGGWARDLVASGNPEAYNRRVS